MKYQLFSIILALFTYCNTGIAQTSVQWEFGCGVHKVFIPLSISQTTLENAKTIEDLNRHYKSSWVKEFKSVDVFVYTDGKERKASSSNDQLTKEQVDLLLRGDKNKEIKVEVNYIPDNNLKQNDVKLFDFKFIVNPEYPASFPGGEAALNSYLHKNVVTKIPDDVYKQYQLAAVQFSVDADGKINNPKVVSSTDDPAVDELLIATIKNMPNWIPATYSTGLKIEDELVLTLGDMHSCTINTLNIRTNDRY